MPLSCHCYWDGDDEGVIFHWQPEDFTVLKHYRAVRCRSCKQLIRPGEECIEFVRFRSPKDEIEDKIYGEGTEIPMASWYQCASCGEQYLNLTAYGYCGILPDENMHELLKEHRENVHQSK